MISVVSGRNASRFGSQIDAMHRLRARVFRDRLRWEVDVQDGREIDDFDRIDPTYLLSHDDVSGRLLGCVRLLPTTGPTMLREVFPTLLPDDDVMSPTIWECSRFALDVEETHTRIGRLSRTTSELLCGMVELGLQVGLTQIVSVYDARMARIFRCADCPAELIGAPQRIGRVTAYAGLFEMSDAMWQRLAKAGGITSPVIASIDAEPQRWDQVHHVAA